MIFETHAHYEDERFDEDRQSLLASMRENGIGWIVNVGSTIETSVKVLSWRSSMILSMQQSGCIRVRLRALTIQKWSF